MESNIKYLPDINQNETYEGNDVNYDDYDNVDDERGVGDII